MMDQSGMMETNANKRILILAANPKATTQLRLDEEIREIKEGLRRARYRSQFDMESILAVRPRDFQRALLDYKPQIVHFTGHGNKEGLLVENEVGFGKLFSSKALTELFKLCSNHVECVILSACYSAAHANAINKHINYVIGMKKEIEDKSALEFAVGFYDALGAGKSFEDAFQFGRAAIMAVVPDLPEHLIPVLKKRKNNHKRTNGQAKEIEGENKKPENPDKNSTNAKQVVNIEKIETFINNF